MIRDELPAHALVGEIVARQMTCYPTVTREPFRNRGRVTDLMASGQLLDDIGQKPLSAETDRITLCGCRAMIILAREMLAGLGLAEGHNAHPGDVVVERAVVER